MLYLTPRLGIRHRHLEITSDGSISSSYTRKCWNEPLDSIYNGIVAQIPHVNVLCNKRELKRASRALAALS